MKRQLPSILKLQKQWKRKTLQMKTILMKNLHLQKKPEEGTVAEEGDMAGAEDVAGAEEDVAGAEEDEAGAEEDVAGVVSQLILT